jgi:hypothetical protein
MLGGKLFANASLLGGNGLHSLCANASLLGGDC